MDTNQKNMVVRNGEKRLNVPSGFRFCPTSFEAMRSYLLAKINNEDYYDKVINEVDVYQYHPYDLPGLDQKEKVGFYFTTRTRKHPNGKRPDRTTKGGDGGFWRMNCKVKEVKDPNGTTIGRRNSLNYYLKSKVKTEWKMHEFVLDQSMLPESKKLDDLVLCKIYVKQKGKGKIEESQGGEENSKRVHQKAFPGESSTAVQQPKHNLKHKQPLLQPRPEIGGSNCQSSQMQPDQLSNYQHQQLLDAPYVDSHAFNCTLSNDIQAPSTDYNRQNQWHHMPINMQSNVFQAPTAGCSMQSQPHQLATSTPFNDFQASLTGYGGQDQPHQLDTSTPSNYFQTPSLGYNSQSQPPISNDFQAPPTSSLLGEEFMNNGYYIDYASYFNDPYYYNEIYR